MEIAESHIQGSRGEQRGGCQATGLRVSGHWPERDAARRIDHHRAPASGAPFGPNEISIFCLRMLQAGRDFFRRPRLCSSRGSGAPSAAAAVQRETEQLGLCAGWTRRRRVNVAWTRPRLDSAPPETTLLRQHLDSTPPGFRTRDSVLHWQGLGAGCLPVDFTSVLSRLCQDSDGSARTRTKWPRSQHR